MFIVIAIIFPSKSK